MEFEKQNDSSLMQKSNAENSENKIIKSIINRKGMFYAHFNKEERKELLKQFVRHSKRMFKNRFNKPN